MVVHLILLPWTILYRDLEFEYVFRKCSFILPFFILFFIYICIQTRKLKPIFPRIVFTEKVFHEGLKK